MIGAGWEKPDIRTASGATGDPILLIDNLTAGNRRGLRIQGIEFSRTTQATAGGPGIRIDDGTSGSGSDITLDSLRIVGSDTVGNDVGIDVVNVAILEIRNSLIDGNETGIRVVKVAGNFLGEINVYSSVIGSNDTAAATNEGVLYQGVSTANALDAAFRVMDSHIQGCGGGRAVHAQHAQSLWLERNVFESGCSAMSNQVYLRNAGGVVINANSWVGNGTAAQDAILVDTAEGGGNIFITNNNMGGEFRDCIELGGAGWSEILIRGNICEHVHADVLDLFVGIDITDTTANNVIIAGNRVTRFATGLQIAAGASSVSYYGNAIGANTTNIANLNQDTNFSAPLLINDAEATLTDGSIRVFDGTLPGFTARDTDNDIEAYFGVTDSNKIFMGGTSNHPVYIRTNASGNLAAWATTGVGGIFTVDAATTNTSFCQGTEASGAGDTITSWAACTSALKYKEDLKPVSLEEARGIFKLTAYDYKWKDRDERDVSVIADDVHKFLPKATQYGLNGRAPHAVENVEGYKQQAMISYLIEIVKDQEKRIKQLEDSMAHAGVREAAVEKSVAMAR